jgi:replicative DNA helicase
LLQGSTRRSSENRVQEITEITTKLKALAKELRIPVLALSQLSRQVESRDDKRPQLSDLRESGSIEQDADVVLFLYREEQYHQKPSESDLEKFAQWLAETDKIRGKAEVIIGKQRHGPTGTIELQFDAAVTRFFHGACLLVITQACVPRSKNPTILFWCAIVCLLSSACHDF